MAIGIIIQARTQSTRFPRKIFEDINGECTLLRVINGASKAQIPNKIILAMPTYDENEFNSMVRSRGFINTFSDERFCTYFGHPTDLTDRYFNAARRNNIDLVVRITADTPLIQGNLIDEMLIEYLKNVYNGYMGNNSTISSVPYPKGLDIEIFPFWLLAETNQLTNDPVLREHVCPFMYRRGTQYNLYEFKNRKPNTMISMKFKNISFDTREDLDLIKAITKEYDKHGDINKAINETNFQYREWVG